MSTRYNFFGGLVTDGMILNLDAAKLQSYSGSGTNWINLINNSISGGTLTNGPTLTGSGKNLAIRFDGGDDYVNLGNIFNFERTTPFTGSFWFKTTTTGTAIRTVFGKAIISSPYTGYQIGLNVATGVSNDEGKVGIVMVGSPFTNVTRKQTAINYNNNTWTQATLTYDGSSTRSGINIFINGTLSGFENYDSENITGTLVNNANFEIGARDGATQPYLGEISTTQIYNRVLSPFDIFQNFNAYKSRYGIPDIVTSGLTLNLDAGNPYSYNPDNTGSTTWVDTTYTTTGGTLINGTSYSGGTMVFDGTNDYVIFNSNKSTTNLTISAWFKSSIIDSNWRKILIFPYGANSWLPPYSSYQITTYQNQVGVSFNVNNDYTVGYLPDTSFTAVANTWYNVTGTFNSGIIKIYVNGVLKGTKDVTASGTSILYTSRTQALLGTDAEYFIFETFAGSIGNTQIYNRTLSDSEITQNFNALRGRYGI
jgi:hypothetical protein